MLAVELIRIGGCIMVLAGCVLLGKLLSGQMEQQVQDVEQWRQVLLQLESEIRYMRDPLPQALKSAGQCGGSRIQETMDRVAGQMADMTGEPFPHIWTESLRSWKDTAAPQVYAELDSLGSRLGQMDTEAQCSAIALAGSRLEQWETKRRAELEGRKKLCRSVSLLAGAAVVIIIL